MQWPEVEGQHLELLHGEVISMPSGQIPREVVKKNFIKSGPLAGAEFNG